MATMTLGPVIGKVTSRTARVLLEIDTAAEIVCTAEAPGKTKVTTCGDSTAARHVI